MEGNNEVKRLYIVVTQTGTVLSRMLKVVTKARFNHASIGLSDDLRLMYSFGRRHPYNPFWGGLVRESPFHGTFARFKDTQAIVMAIDIDEQKHAAILTHIDDMMSRQNTYHYNYLGVALAGLKKVRKKENCYYCSEFVKYILDEFEVEGAEKLGDIVHPMDFLELSYPQVYEGKLQEYSIMR